MLFSTDPKTKIYQDKISILLDPTILPLLLNERRDVSDWSYGYMQILKTAGSPGFHSRPKTLEAHREL